EVFDGVVLIDVEVAGRLHRQVERAMAREQLEHMIEEPDAGRDLVPAFPLDRQLQQNLRLGRPPFDYRAPHRKSSMAFRQRSVSATTPVVIRMQPSHPGSPVLSRMKMPRAFSAAVIAADCGPTRARTKLAPLCQVSKPWRAQNSYSSSRERTT